MKFLIVGFGSIGQQHLLAIKTLYPTAEVALLRREVSHKITGVCCQFVHVKKAAEWRPNYVIIASPASVHIEQYEYFMALESVQSILIEKPISDAVTSLLPTHFQVGNKTVFVGYDMRFTPLFLQLERLVNKAQLGAIIGVSIRVGQALPSWRNSEDFRQDVSAIKSLGGGVLRELSHEIDYALALFGKPSSVLAKTVSGKWLSLPVEDKAYVHWDMALGDSAYGLSMMMDMVSETPFRTLCIEYEEGRINADWLENSITIEAHGAKVEKQLMTPSSALQAEILYLTQSTSASRWNACDLHQAKEVLYQIEKIEASAKEGKRLYD
ncbi:Gfo/Idh/MocA family protein [Marinomonas algicola]|uniref:Gfo/Idh/MocA family protein n=1 Tax=Marinomonas algicola TaxID=2773454 RepID=UPI00174E6656|nr:Gfo/Idh/MocA family oxidoreductase [Marinomonas algicola]